MTNKPFQELLQQTREVIAQFEKIEQRPWGLEGAMIELSKQVGDLSKRVMVAEKYYLAAREHQPAYTTTTEDIADELSDIWYCLVRIADYYKLDLEQTIDQTTQNDLQDFSQNKIT